VRRAAYWAGEPDDRIKALVSNIQNVLEREAGRLARADDVDAAILTFVEAVVA